MATAAASGTASRHPWLAALQAGPEAEVRALVGGYADIPPYGRAEPAGRCGGVAAVRAG